MSAPQKLLQALLKRALSHPDTDEGIACEGTAIEKRTITVRKRAFAFLGARDLMLKLSASLPEATRLAAAEPERYRAGNSGWVSVNLDLPGEPPTRLLEGWIDESYTLMAGSVKKVATRSSTRGPSKRPRAR